jgi:hypothetical protein
VPRAYCPLTDCWNASPAADLKTLMQNVAGVCGQQKMWVCAPAFASVQSSGLRSNRKCICDHRQANAQKLDCVRCFKSCRRFTRHWGDNMGGKMNWDRVRKENLARDHGSEWADPPESIPSNEWARMRPSKKTQLGKRSKTRYRVPPSVVGRTAGCTCGKSLGFTGQHKKGCPKRGSKSSTQHLPVYL